MEEVAEFSQEHDLFSGYCAPEGIIGLIEVSLVGHVTTFEIVSDLKLSLLLQQAVYISLFYHC